MVVVPARALVVEVRLSQRGGIGLARPAILLLAAIGGPGARQSAGRLAERHALGGALPADAARDARVQSGIPTDDVSYRTIRER